MNNMLSARLFEPAPNPTSFSSVLLWWEVRRLAYNLILGCVGIPSLIAYLAVSDTYLKTANSADDFVPLLGVFFFATAANLFYTAGWIVEGALLGLRRKGSRQLGPRLLLLGLIFSVVITVFPVLLITAIALYRNYSHHQ